MAFRVVDAGAFYAGLPASSEDIHHTTPQVISEVSHVKGRHGITDALVDAGRLVIEEPPPESTRAATEAARRTGDLPSLSSADISVLGLAVHLGADLVTDDFALSNAAAGAGVRTIPVMTRGPRRTGRWIYYCGTCGISGGTSGDGTCKRCGGKMRRRLDGDGRRDPASSMYGRGGGGGA
ncbi:Nucleic acid-binding protein (fragment) [Nitrosopumilaceae archaeon]